MKEYFALRPLQNMIYTVVTERDPRRKEFNVGFWVGMMAFDMLAMIGSPFLVRFINQRHNRDYGLWQRVYWLEIAMSEAISSSFLLGHMAEAAQFGYPSFMPLPVVHTLAAFSLVLDVMSAIFVCALVATAFQISREEH